MISIKVNIHETRARRKIYFRILGSYNPFWENVIIMWSNVISIRSFKSIVFRMWSLLKLFYNEVITIGFRFNRVWLWQEEKSESNLDHTYLTMRWSWFHRNFITWMLWWTTNYRWDIDDSHFEIRYLSLDLRFIKCCILRKGIANRILMTIIR